MNPYNLEIGQKYKSEVGVVHKILFLHDQGALCENQIGIVAYYAYERYERWFKRLKKVVPKHNIWINFYPGGSTYFKGYSSRVDADNAAGATRIACVEVEYEKGQGL